MLKFTTYHAYFIVISHYFAKHLFLWNEIYFGSFKLFLHVWSDGEERQGDLFERIRYEADDLKCLLKMV
ncbi:hypothetical protein HanIR_Chr05g0220501 [Helianthus annuus]|nr:hypothetical protein HanIR_Chr05g0220501 [Helianthus annuus]